MNNTTTLSVGLCTGVPSATGAWTVGSATFTATGYTGPASAPAEILGNVYSTPRFGFYPNNAPGSSSVSYFLDTQWTPGSTAHVVSFRASGSEFAYFNPTAAYIPGLNINGGITQTGTQGSTGTKIFSCTGSFTAGDFVSSDANGNCVDSGVNAAASGATINGSLTSNDVVVANGPSSIKDGGPLNYGTATGYCSGTATASSTLTLANLGTPSTTCTVSVPSPVVAGVVLPVGYSGTVRNLSVRCGTTGINSSSGAFTIWYTSVAPSPSNNATSITITYGTTTAGTLVSDTTHTFAGSAGQLLHIRFTTQASETLANCTASFQY